MCDETLTITQHQISPDWMTLEFCGVINDSFHQALEQFSRNMRSSTVKYVAINFSGVNAIDAAGLKVLIMFCVTLRKLSRKVSCFGMNEELMKVFRLLRLDNFMHAGLDQNQAMAIIQSGST